MLELLKQYSIDEVLVFIVLLALAIKGLVSFYDWGKERLNKIFKKENQNKKENEKIFQEIDKNKKEVILLAETQKDMKQQLEEITGLIQILISSDKDDIKSWITREHHYFCYQKKCIDDYSLDCIEKRYKHYKDEKGNSFIDKLMEDIRKLPIKNALEEEEE